MGRRTTLTITAPLHRCLRRSDRQDRWRDARAMGSIRSEPAKPSAIWGMSAGAAPGRRMRRPASTSQTTRCPTGHGIRLCTPTITTLALSKHGEEVVDGSVDNDKEPEAERTA